MRLKENKKVKYFYFTHSYVLDEKTLSGVTSLMKKHGLSANYDGIDEATLNHAAELGKAAHQCIEDYCDGKATVENPLIKSFRKLGLNIIKTEYLISDNEIVASSIDLVNQASETEVDLIDMKRTSTVHRDALSWQLGIYKYLFELANPKIKVRDCYCLPIKKGSKDDIESDVCQALVLIEPKSKDEVKALLTAEKNGEIYQPLFSSSDSGELDLYASGEELCLLANNITKLAELKDTIKVLEGAVAEVQDRIYNKMLEHNIDSLENESMTIKLKRPYAKKALDSKALKAKYPEIAEEMTKESTVKGNIIVTIK